MLTVLILAEKINRWNLFFKSASLPFSHAWKICILEKQGSEVRGGVYMRKLVPARVSYRDDFLIWYRVYMKTGSFHISLFEGTLHVDKIHVWFNIGNITHALLVPVYQQTDFPPERVDVSRLHDTVAKISYQSEILAPVRQPGWTHAGATRACMTFCGGIL